MMCGTSGSGLFNSEGVTVHCRSFPVAEARAAASWAEGADVEARFGGGNRCVGRHTVPVPRGRRGADARSDATSRVRG